jgi:hypothetical protein
MNKVIFRKLMQLYVFIIKITLYTVLSLGLDCKWSKAYRWIYQRDWKDKPVSKYATFKDIYFFIRQQLWVADGAKELWNAYSYPSYFERTGTDTVDSHDCDEFALYQVTVIENAVNEGSFEEKDLTTRMLSVCWIDDKGKQNGHNVCLIKNDLGYRWSDYHLPSSYFSSIEEVARKIVDMYCVSGIITAIAVTDSKLNREKVIYP